MAEKFYNRPSAFGKATNGFMGWLGAHGIGPKKTVRLEVKGRRSGVVRSTAVNVVTHDEQRYLVAPRGETEWVRNARAAAGEAAIRRGKAELVTLSEVPVSERAPIIQTYLLANALETKREFRIDPKAPLEEFEKIADKHPVFRITPRS